jgi:hypothetical protein
LFQSGNGNVKLLCNTLYCVSGNYSLVNESEMERSVRFLPAVYAAASGLKALAIQMAVVLTSQKVQFLGFMVMKHLECKR